MKEISYCIRGHQEIYDIYIDEDNNRYDLLGNCFDIKLNLDKKRIEFIEKKKSGELKIVSYCDIEHQDIYNIYVDKQGNQYDFSGNWLDFKINQDDKKIEFEIKKNCGELNIISYCDVQHQDIYDIYLDKEGNKYSLSGYWLGIMNTKNSNSPDFNNKKKNGLIKNALYYDTIYQRTYNIYIDDEGNKYSINEIWFH